MIFQEVGGKWLRVDSRDPAPPTLADILKDSEHMMEKSPYKGANTNTTKIKNWIYRYSILREGKWVENNIIGWRTALAHARKWQTDLFNNVRKVEILNLWTGEIIDLKEAERRAAKYAQKT